MSDRCPRGHGPQRIFNLRKKLFFFQRGLRGATVANLRSQPEPLQDTFSRRGRFEADFVVDRISEPLLAAQISLRGLDADMSEQELDLLELPAGLMTQTGTGATQIVRSNTIQPAFRAPSLHNSPDDLRTEAGLSDPAGLVDGPKNRAGR